MLRIYRSFSSFLKKKAEISAISLIFVDFSSFAIILYTIKHFLLRVNGIILMFYGKMLDIPFFTHAPYKALACKMQEALEWTEKLQPTTDRI